MMKLKKLLKNDLLVEMANFRPKRTGLPMVVWIYPKNHARHSARIKVQTTHGDKINTDAWVTVTLDNPPKVIGKNLSKKDYSLVKKFIDLNKEGILMVWNDDIDPFDLAEKINKI